MKIILCAIFAAFSLLASESSQGGAASSCAEASADRSSTSSEIPRSAGHGRGTHPPYARLRAPSAPIPSTPIVSYFSDTTATKVERPYRNVYNSAIKIETEGDPIVINMQLESTIYVEGKKVEFVLRLWEVDHLLATKKINVSW